MKRIRKNSLIIILVLVAFLIAARKVYSCGGNQNPLADLAAEPNPALVGETVTLDGSDSYDPDGSIMKYEWDWTNDGTYDYYETPSRHPDGAFDGKATHTYSSAANYTAKLRVTDDDAATDTDTCTVNVGKIKNETQGTLHNSIQAALDDANDGDVIEVSEGVYVENIDFGGVCCTLTSIDPNDWNIVANTIIDGDSSGHVVEFSSGEDGNSVLTGFTITGGSSTNGGGIYCSGASPVIKNCVIRENSANNGGGGMYNNNSDPNVTNCIFYLNSANSVQCDQGGGGMFNSNSSPSVINCVFYKNHTDGDGGGMLNYGNDSDPDVINCTFTKNTADYYGGGMCNGDCPSGGTDSSPTVTNCIFWGNNAVDPSGEDEIHNYSDANPTVTYCDVKGGYGETGNIDADPCFFNANQPAGLDSVFGTFDDGLRVEVHSLCVDAADGNEAASTDIAGRARINVLYRDNNGVGEPNYVDIGAYESAMIWFVDADVADNNDGSSWGEAFADLQDGLSAANEVNGTFADGYGIWVADGNYTATDTNDRSISFELVEGVAVYGGFGGTEAARYQRDWRENAAVLTGDINVPGDINDNSYHVVAGANDAILDGFTITAGKGKAGVPGYVNRGAGVFCKSTSPVIKNCVIIGNRASHGGGIYCDGSTATISNCFFSDNHGGAGGGIHIRECSSSPRLTNCVFSDNTGNGLGGAIYNYSASPVITNCTITGNDASLYGGGMHNYSSSSPTVTNCIFWDNNAVSDGNEVYNNELYNTDSIPTFSCCDIKDSGGSSIWDANLGVDAGGNIDADPCFVDANDPNGPDDIFMTDDDGLRLDSNSPCIDAADGDIAPAMDILGHGWVDIDDVNNTGIGEPNYADIGAYEFYTYSLIYVDKDATSGKNNGTAWANAFVYLQDALDAATSGNEIWVAEGTYYPDDGDSVTENNRSETFQLIDDVNIYGGFDPTTGDDLWSERDWAGNATILDGIIDIVGAQRIKSYHVVTGADATIDGFLIKSGDADGTGDDKGGAGMYNSSCSPTVRNCTFDDHLADHSGAAIYNISNVSLTVEDCIFISCETAPSSVTCGGGAICSYSIDSITIENCIFTGNHASRGGAIFQLYSGSLDISNCLFEDCYAYNIDSSYRGGAIYIQADEVPVNLTNCTIVNNQANRGGGFAAYYSNDVSITNCIFWDNDATSYDQIDNDSSTIVVTYSDIEDGYAGTGNINSDPCFVDDTDPEGNDDEWITSDDGLRLTADSPCIDAADGNYAPLTDIGGASRTDDPNTTNTGIGDSNYVDMGAYEYQG